MAETDEADDSAPNGVRMVAAYRAERLARRQAFRASLHEARAGLRSERLARLRPAAPGPAAAAFAVLPDQTAEETRAPGSVFARLVAAHAAPATDTAHAAPAGNMECAAPKESAALHTTVDAEPVEGPLPVLKSVDEYLTCEVRDSSDQAVPEPVSDGPAADKPTLHGRGSEASVSVQEAPYGLASPAPAGAATPTRAAESVTCLGFGPGMEIRFRQIGITSVADLAAAEAAGLREALGDVGALLNVETWIAEARNRAA